MPSEHYDIDNIERYLTHQMGKEERAAFEGQLQEDEGYSSEVAAYRQLLAGFQARRSENFRRQLAAWEQAAGNAHADEAEYIEWYLSGELKGEARTLVEKKAAEDEAFARELAAYRQIHEGFLAARSENFREKMQGWERGNAQKPSPRLAARRPLWPRIAAAAAILLLAGFGFNWYVQNNFSGDALIGSYYRPSPGENMMGGEAPAREAVSNRYEEAHRLFRQEDYQAAYQAFDALLAELPAAPIDSLSRSLYRQNSEWNRLLAALALQPPPFNPEEETRRIANTEGHAFRQQAGRLLKNLQSPLYKWAN